MNKLIAMLLALLVVGGCSRPQPQPRLPRSSPGAKGALVAEQRHETVRRATLDPKSSDAAVELVRGFAALLNSGHVDDAYMLLGPRADGRGEFKTEVARFPDVHVEVGAAERQEGAAGSTFVTIPITLSRLSKPNSARRSAKIILRRVNDVPGSTEAQRHWHIENIDWGS